MALTKTEIEAAKPKDKPYRLTDRDGLYLDVRATSKSWRYRYRIAGRENIHTFGRYPEMSRDEAREALLAVRKLLAQGKDPSQERKLERIRAAHANAQTFRAIFDEWVASRAWAETTRRNRLSQIEFHVLPYLGPLPVREITPMHVLDVLRRAERPGTSAKKEGRGARVREVGSPNVARRLRHCIASVFNVAIATGRADSNPAGSLREVLTPAVRATHKTPLRPKQVGDFLRELDAYRGDPKTVMAFRLLWWSMLRPGEVVAAHWDEFDLEAATWTIPRARMKNKNPQLPAHVVPLPRQAVEKLATWKAFTGGIGYPSALGTGRPRTCRPGASAAERDRRGPEGGHAGAVVMGVEADREEPVAEIRRLANEIEAFFDENSVPMPNPTAVRKIGFLCGRLGAFDHYVGEKAGYLQADVKVFFSVRKHARHGGADEVYSRIKGYLRQIRARASNIEKLARLSDPS